MSRGKNVLISVCRWNGALALNELMRTAVALASGFRGHAVKVALVGEGVLTAVKPSSDGWGRYYRAARAYPINFYVQQESLERLGLKAEDLAIEVKLASGEEMLELGREAELQLKL